jgi:hypothetical protein
MSNVLDPKLIHSHSIMWQYLFSCYNTY